MEILEFKSTMNWKVLYRVSTVYLNKQKKELANIRSTDKGYAIQKPERKESEEWSEPQRNVGNN